MAETAIESSRLPGARGISVSTASPHPEERTKCASRRVGNERVGGPPFETHRYAMLLRVRWRAFTTLESDLAWQPADEKGGYADEARTLHGDAVAPGRGPRAGAQEPDRAGEDRQGERAYLTDGRAAFRVEPIADVPGDAVAGAARGRSRGHEAGAGAVAPAAAQSGGRRRGNGDARLALRWQRHPRPGAGLSPGGVRLHPHPLQGTPAALRRGGQVGGGSGTALEEVREPLAFKYEAYASWSGASGFVPAERIRANFDTFAADRFIIGSESQVVDLIGRYGERTGTDHMLLRVQWPGLDPKTVGRQRERAGRGGGEADEGCAAIAPPL